MSNKRRPGKHVARPAAPARSRTIPRAPVAAKVAAPRRPKTGAPWWHGPGRELDDIADLGPLARFARPLTRRLPVPALYLLLVAAAVALVIGLVAGGSGEGARPGTALGLCAVAALMLPIAARPLGGKFGWLLPGILRAIEYGLLVRLVAVIDPGAMPAAFGFLAAMAYHHYDTVYRWRHTGRGPAPWANPAGLGVEGRLLVLAGLVSVTADLTVPLAVLAVAMGVTFLAESAVGWRAWLRSGPTAVD